MDLKALYRLSIFLTLAVPAETFPARSADIRTIHSGDGPAQSVRTVAQSSSGLVLAGSDRGLSYVLDDTLRLAFPGAPVNCIYENGPDSFLLGTDEGLFCASEGKCLPLSEKFGLRENVTAAVSGIVTDSAGAVWFCTKGEGVFRFNPSTSSLMQYFVRGTDNDCLSLSMDSEDRVTVRLHSGEYVFNSSTEQFSTTPLAGNGPENMSPRDTLVDREGGRWIAAGRDGLKYCLPEDSFASTPAPGVMITRVRSGSDDYATGGRIVLRAPVEELSISASALSYRNPSMNRCSGRLYGRDKKPVELASGQEFTYRSLKAGKYRFSVSACDDLGICSDLDASVEIVVKPRPLLSPLAFILYILVALAVCLLPRLIRKLPRRTPEGPSAPATPETRQSGTGGTAAPDVPAGETAPTRPDTADTVPAAGSARKAMLVSVADTALSGSVAEVFSAEMDVVVSAGSDPDGILLVISDDLSLAGHCPGVPFIYLYRYEGSMKEALPESVSAAVMVPFDTLLLHSLAAFLIDGRSFAGAGSDRQLYVNMQRIIEANVANTELSVDMLCSRLGISRSGLFSKVKAVSGSTPNAEITAAKMRASARLLGEGRYNISDISCMVGFNSPSYFSKCFHKQFGVMPNEWVADRRKDPS